MRRLPIQTRRLLASLCVLLLAACDIVDIPGTVNQPAAPTQPAVSETNPPPEVAQLPAPQLLEQALNHRTLGDYDQAAGEFHALAQNHPDSPEARLARFYLAESFAFRGRWTSAAEAFTAFLGDGVNDEWSAKALFWLARSHEEAGAWSESVRVYDQYRALNTSLEPYARVRQAAQQQAQGQLEQAAESYEAVAASDIARGEKAGSHEKAIALRRQLGQNDIALSLYTQLLTIAEGAEYRPRILDEAASLAREVGALDQARAWERELLETLPESPQALGVVAVQAADPQSGLTPTTVARVYEVHTRYAEALPFFDAAIAGAAGDEVLELRRRRALALRGAGDLAGALAELAAIGAEAPNGKPGRQAQLDWIQTVGQAGDTQRALDAYRQFAQTYPEDPRVPEALSRAAVLLNRLDDTAGAAQQQLELGRRYPTSEQAQTALNAAGWHFYWNGRPSEAREAWELLGKNSSGTVAARALFWAARAAREAGLSDIEAPLLDSTLQAAPESYYGQRAAELRGVAPAPRISIGTPITVTQWLAAEAWVAQWANQPSPQVDAQGYPSDVVQQGPVARAIALAEVGLYNDATAEWNEARERWRKDPTKLYLVARLAHEHGVPYSGLKATEDLLALAPSGTPPLPEALQRLRFPTPYHAEITARAAEFGVDPRAVYALMRQESLFDPRATSWVGARGLAQVMPATGQGIAQSLQVTDFAETDLYRPSVSIRFGTFYLSQQMAQMNGSLPGALAAYNGGLGNSQRWANGATVDDPDLFVEIIDYPETEQYVKLVYGYYGAYQRLYSWP